MRQGNRSVSRFAQRSVTFVAMHRPSLWLMLVLLLASLLFLREPRLHPESAGNRTKKSQIHSESQTRSFAKIDNLNLDT
jgi:hypothetical protein